MDLMAFWDSPFVGQIAFHPRRGHPKSSHAASFDGTIPVGRGPAQLGYRFYGRADAAALPVTAPVFVYFHGNAEVCSDLDHAIDGLLGEAVAGVLSVARHKVLQNTVDRTESAALHSYCLILIATQRSATL